MNDLFHSRRFLLALFDLIASTLLYFGGKYAGASVAADIQWLVVAVQPVFLYVAYRYSREDELAMQQAHERDMQTLRAQEWRDMLAVVAQSKSVTENEFL